MFDQSALCSRGIALSDRNTLSRDWQPVVLFLVLVLLLAHGLFAFTSPARAENPLTITNVSMRPQFFDPRKGETTKISCKLSQEARVTLKIYDESDYLIKILLNSINRPGGDINEYWNGTDQMGRPVPGGLYRFTIRATNKKGETVLSDLSDITGGQENQVASSEIDTRQGIIKYVLRSPSMVITRLGLKEGGPLLRTLEFRKFRPAGLNRVRWDGFDNSRTVNFLEYLKLNYLIQAYSLSANSIVVLGPEKGSGTSAAPARISREKRSRKKTVRKIIRKHWQHPPEMCRDPELEIKLPQGMKRDPDGVPMVSGPLDLRVDVSEKDHVLLTEERFEVMFFVDFLFVYEDETGFLPFNWTWNPQNTSKGLHYITVNLIGYEGHIGSATLKMRVSQ